MTISDKRQVPHQVTLQRAIAETSYPMKSHQTWDHVIVSIHRGTIVALEANEWDATIKAHRTVTLYLQPEQAIWIADQLNTCAAAMLKPSRNK